MFHRKEKRVPSPRPLGPYPKTRDLLEIPVRDLCNKNRPKQLHVHVFRGFTRDHHTPSQRTAPLPRVNTSTPQGRGNIGCPLYASSIVFCLTRSRGKGNTHDGHTVVSLDYVVHAVRSFSTFGYRGVGPRGNGGGGGGGTTRHPLACEFGGFVGVVHGKKKEPGILCCFMSSLSLRSGDQPHGMALAISIAIGRFNISSRTPRASR